MSKWLNENNDCTFDSYEEACDNVSDELYPSDVINYIIDTTDEKDIIAALDGNKPNFYTDKFMELAEKQCADYIYEILETEEEEEKDSEI